MIVTPSLKPVLTLFRALKNLKKSPPAPTRTLQAHPPKDGETVGTPKLFCSDNDLKHLYRNLKTTLTAGASQTNLGETDRDQLLSTQVSFIMNALTLNAIVGDEILPLRNAHALRRALDLSWPRAQ